MNKQTVTDVDCQVSCNESWKWGIRNSSKCTALDQTKLWRRKNRDGWKLHQLESTGTLGSERERDVRTNCLNREEQEMGSNSNQRLTVYSCPRKAEPWRRYQGRRLWSQIATLFLWSRQQQLPQRSPDVSGRKLLSQKIKYRCSQFQPRRGARVLLKGLGVEWRDESLLTLEKHWNLTREGPFFHTLDVLLCSLATVAV